MHHRSPQIMLIMKIGLISHLQYCNVLTKNALLQQHKLCIFNKWLTLYSSSICVLQHPNYYLSLDN